MSNTPGTPDATQPSPITDRAGTRELPDVADTEAFGAELATTLSAGDLVILDGPLGAGKTALARGIGRIDDSRRRTLLE